MAKIDLVKHKKLIASLGLLGVFLFINFGLLLPLEIKNLKAVSLKLKEKRVNLRHYQKYSADLKRLDADIEKVKKDYVRMENMLFPESKLPLLLDDISRQANSLSVKIMQIKPEPADAKKDLRSPAGFYPIFIWMETVCGYHQLGSLLGRLEANPLISVDSLKLNRNSLDSARQDGEVILKAYVSKK